MTEHTFMRIMVLALSLIPSPTLAQHLTEDAIIKGIVVDASGASVQQAHVRIIGIDEKVEAEVVTGQDGRFELSSPVEPATLLVEARGFDRFQKSLHLTSKTVETLDVTLTLGCLPGIEHIIPLKPDLRNFLVEIHYRGSFGGCPDRSYRLWGSGKTSITYLACSGKTLKEGGQVDQQIVATTLTELARKYPNPTCSYYPGGIDAATVDFTLVSGSEPRVVISHDQGDKIEGITKIEGTLERLIDPEKHMQTFAKESERKRIQ